jgi:hypothetical protein
MELNDEQTAMAKVLKAMRVPTRQVRELLQGTEFKSIGEFNETLKEEEYGNFTTRMEDRAFDTLAQVITYMNINGFPTFLSVTDDNDAFLAMQNHVGSLIPVDESLIHFYGSIHLFGYDGYMLHVRHGIFDYASLHQRMGQLDVAGLADVSADQQIQMWRFLRSMTPPDSIGFLEDPLGDFNMQKSLRVEMDVFLRKFGFTDSDMEHIFKELTYPHYERLIAYDYDLKVGAGALAHIPADQRNLLRRVICFMSNFMEQVSIERRMLEFDFNEFYVHESLRTVMNTFLARLGFTVAEMEEVREFYRCCSYENLTNPNIQSLLEYLDGDIGSLGPLRGILPNKQRLLCKAIHFMQISMEQVPTELRMAQFDFTAFFGTQGIVGYDDDDDQMPVRIRFY